MGIAHGVYAVSGTKVFENGNPALPDGGLEILGGPNGPADALNAPDPAANGIAGSFPVLKPIGDEVRPGQEVFQIVGA